MWFNMHVRLAMNSDKFGLSRELVRTLCLVTFSLFGQAALPASLWVGRMHYLWIFLYIFAEVTVKHDVQQLVHKPHFLCRWILMLAKIWGKNWLACWSVAFLIVNLLLLSYVCIIFVFIRLYYMWLLNLLATMMDVDSDMCLWCVAVCTSTSRSIKHRWEDTQEGRSLCRQSAYHDGNYCGIPRTECTQVCMPSCFIFSH